MKKKLYQLTFFLLFICIGACTGYEPIFTSTNIQYQIKKHSVSGEKNIAKQIYSKLYNLTKSNKNESNVKSIDVSIEVTKEKNPTVKNSAGKILEYKIILSTKVFIKDYFTNEKILSENFVYSSSYKVQDQFAETLRLKNKSIENLINTTHQNLIIKLVEIK